MTTVSDIKKAEFPAIDRAATGARLRKLRMDHNISVRDLAKYLYLSSLDSIYHWENGLSLPTIDNLYALSKLYQIPMEELLER